MNRSHFAIRVMIVAAAVVGLSEAFYRSPGAHAQPWASAALASAGGHARVLGEVAAQSPAEALYERAIARASQGDNQGAIEDLNQALALNPNYTDAFMSRAYARAALGDNRGAIDDFTQALRLAPNEADAYLGRAYARMHLDDPRGAAEDFTRALELNP